MIPRLIIFCVSRRTNRALNVARDRITPVLVVVHLRPTGAPGLFTTENPLNDKIQSVVVWLRVRRILVLDCRGTSQQLPQGYLQRDSGTHTFAPETDLESGRTVLTIRHTLLPG